MVKLRHYNSDVCHELCISRNISWTCSTESVLDIGEVLCRGFQVLNNIHRPVFVLCKLLDARAIKFGSAYFT